MAERLLAATLAVASGEMKMGGRAGQAGARGAQDAAGRARVSTAPGPRA